MFSPVLLVTLAGVLFGVLVETQVNTVLDTNSVALNIKKQWCTTQISACDTLCSSVTNKNDCDDESLNYECECTNYPTPILTSYRGTMPTLICLQLFANCKKDAGTSLLEIGKCSTDYYIHCGTKYPVDFEPHATTSSSETTSTSDASSGTSTIIITQSTNTENATLDQSTTSDRAITSDISTTISNPTKPTDTLATSTTNSQSIPTNLALVAQNTTAASLANTPHKKGASDLAVMGIVLGVVGGVAIVALVIIWKMARLKARRDKEKAEGSEAEERSLRSNRGSVLLMKELSANAIRNHLAQLEAEGGGAYKSKTQNPVSPVELPSHFSRSHSRVFEME